jgi:hypothetical protein
MTATRPVTDVEGDALATNSQTGLPKGGSARGTPAGHATLGAPLRGAVAVPLARWF